MRPGSLQRRMLLLSAAASLLVTMLFGWAVAAVLQRFVTDGFDGRLDAQLALLASAVDRDGSVDRARLARDGGLIASGPGLRWRIAGPDGVIGDAGVVAGPRPPAPPPEPPGARFSGDQARAPGPRPVDGTDPDGTPVHARTLTLQSQRGPVSLLAAVPLAVLRQPIRAALWPLLSLLAALLLLLAAAAVIQLRVGLAPVRRLRDEVGAIRGGRRDRVDENQPEELRPLAIELNALADDNRAALHAARQSGANLAHALKTPVAVLALDLRDDPERSAQLARIDATIRHHLRRARIASADRRIETALAPAVEGVLTALRHLHADRGLSMEAVGQDGVSVAMDPHDLDEMLGNLLDNAATHARSRVWLAAAIDPADARRVIVEVGDDGPGIPADRMDRVSKPGARLDENGNGNGFGLAIVADLLSLHGGTMALGERPGGGLSVRLSIPGRFSG